MSHSHVLGTPRIVTFTRDKVATVGPGSTVLPSSTIVVSHRAAAVGVVRVIVAVVRASTRRGSAFVKELTRGSSDYSESDCEAE